ncbi:MAG: peptidoglycan DD-metalloendopeptidase family protein [Bdellovibrionaceae bacterium]|nr:peptidoglycan DD-metalloendopeptidase family protein [Pseudobdellovibrionaceae bacterium]MDW8189532.1 peptidoglycan DD-metalloendopeptidase family protein [Pseudobdellovibrionaceae bacterium]
MFTSNTANPIKLELGYRTLVFVTLGLFFLFVVSVLLLVQFNQFVLESLEKKRVIAENQNLKKQLSQVENKIEALELSLARSKSFITKLKLITNSEDPSYGLNLAQMPVNLESRSGFSFVPFYSGPEEKLSQDGMALELPTEQSYDLLSIRIDRSIEETELQEQSLTELWQLLSDRQAFLAAMPSVKPSRGWISSTFGYRPHPFSGRTVLHAGIDIAANSGTPIVAPASGVVTFVGYDEGYGKVVEIDHGFGLSTRFGHCSQIFVKIGQQVNRFDVIASVGNTGRSTGSHLHYEVRFNGIPRNPLLFILDED